MDKIIQMLQYCEKHDMREQARGILQAWYLRAHEDALDYDDETRIGEQLSHLQTFVPHLMAMETTAI